MVGEHQFISLTINFITTSYLNGTKKESLRLEIRLSIDRNMVFNAIHFFGGWINKQKKWNFIWNLLQVWQKKRIELQLSHLLQYLCDWSIWVWNEIVITQINGFFCVTFFLSFFLFTKLFVDEPFDKKPKIKIIIMNTFEPCYTACISQIILFCVRFVCCTFFLC